MNVSLKNLAACLIVCGFLSGIQCQCCGQDTLSPLKDKSPQDLQELWAGYDPAKEPLDIEVLKEWEEDGVVCRVIRYRVGIFKGVKSMMAAVYGFPKGGTKLPGLVQVHGGGQSANLAVVTTNAKRGYACISINYGGNQLNDGKYQKIWDKPGTDWGAIDATQNGHNLQYYVLTPDAKTVDSIESPRNNNWFLLVLAARRALTFLQQQPEVDPNRFGIYGHSMGGKISLDTAAIDKRVKACAPSCGGSEILPEDTLYGRTINDSAYAKILDCPIIFLNPSNDFFGSIDGIEHVVSLMNSKEYRYTRPPHLNHRSTPEYTICGLLWFDQHLKGNFRFPETPKSSLKLKSSSGIPEFTVVPDNSKPVECVDSYYTQGDANATVDRFWHHAKSTQQGSSWTAALPLLSINQPLSVYANVQYKLDKPETGAGYYYGVYIAKSFSIASKMHTATAAMLKSSGVVATLQPSTLIESFKDSWLKEWYVFSDTGQWPYHTLKLTDNMWKAHEYAKLALDIKAEQPNKLIVQLDNFTAVTQIKGGKNWQNLEFYPSDFANADGNSLPDWTKSKELVIGPDAEVTMNGKQIHLGGDWQGSMPEFRNLRWVSSTKDELAEHRQMK